MRPSELHLEMVEAIELLELGPEFAELQASPSFKAAQTAYQRLQEQAKANHRRLAFDAHPDRGGALESMQRLNAAKDLVMAVAIAPPRPKPVRVVIFAQGPGVFNSWFSGTSATGDWF